MRTKYLLLFLTAVTLLVSCGGDDTPQPKPKAYLRIDMPHRHYVEVDTLRPTESPDMKPIPSPFHFIMNDYAILTRAKQNASSTAIELYYPEWKGYVTMMYKHIRGTDDLRAQIDTAIRMLSFHQQVASGIDETLIQAPDNHVYATVWSISGRNVATTYQFIATDSTAHFLHGEIIIDQTPNNDSLAPMLEYMQTDVDNLIKTLRWR